VTWVTDYLILEHGNAQANAILDDIDRRFVSPFALNLISDKQGRIAAVPTFSGLRRFPEGRGFKQWTGDDSKALMKVCHNSDLFFLYC
jgi:hypothetical protein